MVLLLSPPFLSLSPFQTPAHPDFSSSHHQLPALEVDLLRLHTSGQPACVIRGHCVDSDAIVVTTISSSTQLTMSLSRTLNTNLPSRKSFTVVPLEVETNLAGLKASHSRKQRQYQARETSSFFASKLSPRNLVPPGVSLSNISTDERGFFFHVFQLGFGGFLRASSNGLPESENGKLLRPKLGGLTRPRQQGYRSQQHPEENKPRIRPIRNTQVRFFERGIPLFLLSASATVWKGLQATNLSATACLNQVHRFPPGILQQ